MGEQRIDTAADAATSTDADPGEGLGLTSPPSAGGDAEMPQPTADRSGGRSADSGDTEGESYLKDTQAKQGGAADLGGRRPAAPSGPSGAAGASGAGSRPEPADRRGPTAETGEVPAPPSPERRAEDPGSAATEFGDRADEAPDTEIAHPSI